jgi:ureidoacrylate peracid hydrolase
MLAATFMGPGGIVMTSLGGREALAANTLPGATALVVVDVQNDFCAKGGYFDKTGADLSLIAPAVERLAGLIDTARAAGVMPIFVRSHYDAVYLSEAQNARRRRVGWHIPLCEQGTWGVEFYRIAPRPGEVVVTKHRYDAFHNTDLELVLRTNNIRNVVLAGVATNVCVESTLRSAFFRDFEVVMASDCCAARTTRAHDGALENVRQHFGLVATCDDLQQVWSDAVAPLRTAAVNA